MGKTFFDTLPLGEYATKTVARIDDGIDMGILEDNPMFASILEEFLNYLNEEGNARKELHDLNYNNSILYADDENLNRLVEELAPYLPLNMVADKRLVLHLITDFYQMKGSVESIRYFFRILFNLEINIYYPEKNVFKLSDNVYNKDLYPITGWKNTNSFLSSDQYITDGYYYQPYSYVIEVGIDIDRWKYPFTRLVHPAGLKFFGRVVFTVEDSFDGLNGKDYWDLAQPGLIRDVEQAKVYVTDTSNTSYEVGSFRYSYNLQSNTINALPNSILNKLAYAYRPQDAITTSTGKIISIPNQKGGGINLIQNNDLLRPTLVGDRMRMSANNNQELHMFMSSNLSTPTTINNIVELVIVTDYRNGTTSTFTGFDTLISGNGGLDYPRIAGNRNTNSLLTQGFESTSKVRVNNNTASSNLLPLGFNPVSTIMGTYTSPTASVSSLRLIGKSFNSVGRSWVGNIGYMLFFSAPLTEEERVIVNNFINDYHKYYVTPMKETYHSRYVNQTLTNDFLEPNLINPEDIYFRLNGIGEYDGYDIDDILIGWDKQPGSEIKQFLSNEALYRDEDDL